MFNNFKELKILMISRLFLKAKSYKLKAFTVIELIVAMTVFVVLMSIAAGGFIHLLKSQRVVAALMTANDSASLTMEQMAREIRTGYNFCLTPSGKLEFVSAIRNEVVRYRLNNGSIEKGVSGISGETSSTCSDLDDSWFVYKKLTADNVKIGNFNVKACGKNISPDFLLDGCGSGGNNYPPRITLGLSVTSAEPDVAKLGIYVPIQTTVSARRIQ
ncbi:MAG: prepilin-type N-terminal cleavage/methylation domain-containing protein [Patescibacteria group bacterium]